MKTLNLIGEMLPKNCIPLETAIGLCNDDMTICIDSPGGQVDCGIRLAIALAKWAENHPENSLTLEVGAMACSMAANLLALAPARAVIKGYSASSIMFHSCRGFAEGTPADIIASAKWMNGINAQVVAGLSKRTGKPEDFFAHWFKEAEHWLTGAEALEIGLFGALADGQVAINTERLVALYKVAKAINNQEENMDEEKKTCAEETLAEVKEVVEENAPVDEEKVVEEVKEEIVEETTEAEEGEETVEEIIEALKAKVAELTEEVEALKATKAKLTAGLKLRKDAPKATNENWADLVKTIPTAQNPRDYAAQYEALKKAHPAAYAQYMKSHSAIPTFGRNK